MSQRTPSTLVFLVLALLVAACTPVTAPPASTDADVATTALPTVTIEVTADGLQVPAEIPSGIVTVTYKNSTDAPASPSVGWLMKGRTVAEFEQALQEDNFPAILEMAITPGGADLAPGEAEQVTHELPAGEILVVNFPEDGPPQMTTTTATTGDAAVTAPTAEFTAEMADFSFTMPDKISAGAHLWEMRNTGQQWHHLIVLKLNEGVTIDDLLALATSETEPEGPPPFEEVAFFGDMSPGTTSWVTLDILAGEYTVVCFLPNIDDEQMAPHLAHGMIRTLVVE